MLANQQLIARTLLEFGADPSIMDRAGRTALVWATRCEKVGAANALLEWQSGRRSIRNPSPVEAMLMKTGAGGVQPLVMPPVSPPVVGQASPRRRYHVTAKLNLETTLQNDARFPPVGPLIKSFGGRRGNFKQLGGVHVSISDKVQTLTAAALSEGAVYFP